MVNDFLLNLIPEPETEVIFALLLFGKG